MSVLLYFEDMCCMWSRCVVPWSLEGCCCLLSVLRMEVYFCGPDIVVISVGAWLYLVGFLWCRFCECVCGSKCVLGLQVYCAGCHLGCSM